MTPITLRDIVKFLPEKNESVLFREADRLNEAIVATRKKINDECRRLNELELQADDVEARVLSDIRRLWKDSEIADAAKLAVVEQLGEL